MSVQINQYLMHGVKFNYKEFEDLMENAFGEDYEGNLYQYERDSAYKYDLHHTNGLFLLRDGMGGEYVILGKALKKSIDGEYLPNDGPMRIRNIKKEEKEQITLLIREHFKINVEPKQVGIYYITHYS